MTVRKIIAFGTVAFVLIGVLAGALFYEYAQSPIDHQGRVVTIEIPKGMNFMTLLEALGEKGLIRYKSAFCLLARMKDAPKHIKAGEYELNSVMTPTGVIDTLLDGKVKEYEITIPEGFTVRQIADRLAQQNLIDRDVFLRRICDVAFLSSLKIREKSAEGYLFPDTYKLNKSMDEFEIVRFMVKRFRREITPEAIHRAAGLGFTIHELVTLASIVEKESGREEEKPLISAVFHNRLKKRMRLQSDPTVIYGIENFNGNLTKADLRKQSPYNTYRIKGLPPGPICNPGAASIQAVLYPAPVDYLFFVSKNDGSHQFSSNLSSHDKAVIKYQIKRKK